MFESKRLAIFFFILTMFLLATDTQAERQIRKSLLSFFDIVVEEGGQVSDTAPTSFLQTVESARVSTYNFLSHSGDFLNDKANSSTGVVSFLMVICTYLIYILKFIANYIITFYPFVIFLLYLFFTANIFKKDEFSASSF